MATRAIAIPDSWNRSLVEHQGASAIWDYCALALSGVSAHAIGRSLRDKHGGLGQSEQCF